MILLGGRVNHATNWKMLKGNIEKNIRKMKKECKYRKNKRKVFRKIWKEEKFELKHDKQREGDENVSWQKRRMKT